MKYLHRDLLDELEKWLDRKEILAIKGPRQSGKTTLLNIIKEYLVDIEKINPESIVYVTFEDRDILDAFSRDPKEYIKSYINSSKDKRLYFLIDEFQYLKEGGQKLKLLYDIYENVKFIITGSSSLELTSSTARYLVGRIFSFHLYEFSLSEFLQTKEKNLYNAYKENSQLCKNFLEKGKDFDIKEDIFEKDFAKYFEEYVRFGGYPEVIKTPDIETKQIILKNIYNTYVTRDIIELLRIENISNFRTVVTLLANNIGDLLNYNSLAADSKSYFKQIKHYLSILEETFIIRILRPYFSNIITELKKNPKIYFVDTGLRNYIINNFNELGLRRDAGKLVENVVLSQIYREENTSIKYWRTTARAEVDFILDDKRNIMPIEVKYSRLNRVEISRSFKNFVTEYKPKRALILTKGFWGRVKIDRTQIGFIPAWYT